MMGMTEERSSSACSRMERAALRTVKNIASIMTACINSASAVMATKASSRVSLFTFGIGVDLTYFVCWFDTT